MLSFSSYANKLRTNLLRQHGMTGSSVFETLGGNLDSSNTDDMLHNVITSDEIISSTRTETQNHRECFLRVGEGEV